MKLKPIWKTFFSQSGSEIYQISEQLNRYPDIIVTNKKIEDMDKINSHLLEKAFDRIIFAPSKPTVEEYESVIRTHASLITLHGYLRIIPPEICSRYKIYNGHPGLITDYPELKGKDPQKRAWEHKPSYPWHGHVIHEVIPEVDAGKVLRTEVFGCEDIQKDYMVLDSYIRTLHSLAIKNWVAFLKDKV